MNKIEVASTSDRKQLEQLYDLSFPGEPDFRAMFFDRVWKPEHTYLIRKNSDIASAVQAIPIKMQDEHGVFSAVYIYAAGTYPQFKGQGMMTQLLEHVHIQAKEQGCELSVLITQNDDLFAYYKRLGYSEAFFATTEKPENQTPVKVQIATLKHSEDIAKIYSSSMQGRLSQYRDAEFYRLQIEFYGNDAFVCGSDDGITAYAFYDRDTNTVKEAFGKDSASLCAQIGAVQRILPGGKQCYPMGCAFALTERGAQSLQGEKPPYLNLLFN